MVKRGIPTHIFTLTVGKKLSERYLDMCNFNYVFGGKYDKTIPQGDWRDDRQVTNIETILIEGEYVTVVQLNRTSDELYIPIKDFKL